MSDAAGSGPFRLTIVQNGSSVNGTYSNGRGDRGSFSGTLSGTHFSGMANSAVLHISCIVSGDVANGGATFTGTVACDNGTGREISVTHI